MRLETRRGEKTRQDSDVTAATCDPSISILDLASIGRGQSVADALANSVALARHAETHGYERVWYAEHHNMSLIASSAPAVLIAHIANHTSTIRLGAGGVMLPNHSPLTIAEQYGMLAELHPGRIDLGVGRAPGTDQTTWRALRRDPHSSDRFPGDVRELRGYLDDRSVVAGVNAIPGAGTSVPIYILGSSLFGARLAAEMGLPYAFASHFAPGALLAAIELYRDEFQPSPDLAEPYAMGALNVIACDDDDDARAQFDQVRRERIAFFLARDRELAPERVDELVASPQGQQVAQMMHYSAVGTAAEVGSYVREFARHAQLDEVISAHPSPTLDRRLRSVELLAEAMHTDSHATATAAN